MLFDLGAHPLALALLLAAPARPVEVRAVLEGADDHPVDEHAEVTIRFDTGAVARVVASWRGTGSPVWDAQARRPTGVVRLELLPAPPLERNGVEVPLPEPPDGVPAPLVRPRLRRPARGLRPTTSGSGTPPALGAAFGRSVLDLTCAAYASAGRGRRAGSGSPSRATGTPHRSSSGVDRFAGMVRGMSETAHHAARVPAALAVRADPARARSPSR